MTWFKQALEKRFEIKSSCVGISPTAVGGSGRSGSPSAPVSRPKTPTSIPLRKLTEYKNKKGDISSVLAWDDLTHMKLDAGKVKEAR